MPKLPAHREKWCHDCGDSVGVYSLKENAPFCKKCWKIRFPDEEFRDHVKEGEKPKLLNEKQMVDKILFGEKK